jgi:hypothetical protein
MNDELNLPPNGTLLKPKNLTRKICNSSLSSGIPLASPFEKGGLRGIFSNATRTY